MGLYLYPNGGGPNGWQFEPENLGPTHPYTNNPEYNRSPGSLSGTPESDVITFGLERYLYFSIHMWWRPFLATGVKQRRLTTGQLILEAERGSMMRAVWDVRDRRTGDLYQETATGVVQAVADLTPYRESWQLILTRGDFLLRAGVLEAALRGPNA